MGRRKRDLWKVGTAFTGVLLLLVLKTWVPLLVASAHQSTSGLATPGTVTVQATPTVDPAITAKTAREQLTKLQRDNDRSFQALFWSSGATFLSTLVVALAGVLGFLRYLRDQRNERQNQREDRRVEQEKRDREQQRWLQDQETEREKRAEERFQAIVGGLGSERIEAKVGAAIMLRTFLRPGYEQFYGQAFDLSVAHLRLRKADPETRAASDAPLLLDSLSQALITVFKESFPLACKEIEKRDGYFNQDNYQLLDASRIWLDNAYIVQSPLEYVWLREADLNRAHLNRAHLRGAYLRRAHLRGAYLSDADLRETNLSFTDLSGADLSRTKLSGAWLFKSNLSRARLIGADLSGVRDLEEAQSLEGTDLRGAKGLNTEQKASCKAKGAIIDELLSTWCRS